MLLEKETVKQSQLENEKLAVQVDLEKKKAALLQSIINETDVSIVKEKADAFSKLFYPPANNIVD